MKPRVPNPHLTDAQLDAALGAEQDGILPSSGFAGSVMAAVAREAAAPAPIPFPWKRAIPGLVAAAAALALIVTLLAAVLRSRGAASQSAVAGAMAPAVSSATFWSQQMLALWLHRAASPDVLWPLASVAIPLLCLLLMRRLLFAR